MVFLYRLSMIFAGLEIIRVFCGPDKKLDNLDWLSRLYVLWSLWLALYFPQAALPLIALGALSYWYIQPKFPFQSRILYSLDCLISIGILLWVYSVKVGF